MSTPPRRPSAGRGRTRRSPAWTIAPYVGFARTRGKLRGSREVKRGSRYEGIVLDPPKYGRGPAGEVWRLFEDLPELAGRCAELLADDAGFLLLNAYAARISGLSLGGLVSRTRSHGRGGRVDWGELACARMRRRRSARGRPVLLRPLAARLMSPDPRARSPP